MTWRRRRAPRRSGELVGLSRDRLLDGCATLRRVQPFALWRGKDEVEDAARSSTNSDSMRSVACRSPESRTRPSGCRRRRRPRRSEPRGCRASEDDAPRMRRTGAHPPRERSGRQTLVRPPAGLPASSLVPFRHRSLLLAADFPKDPLSPENSSPTLVKTTQPALEPPADFRSFRSDFRESGPARREGRAETERLSL